MFSKHRIEALSDAIFAIVMTLLVLDLKVPETIGPGGLLHALAADRATWASFFLTFLLASVFWVLQHQVFDLLEAISHQTLIPTFVFLGFVTILPFSTALLGHHPQPLSGSLYFANMFALAASLTAKLEVSRTMNHIRTGLAMRVMRAELYSMCIIMGASGLAPLLLPPSIMWIIPVGLVLITRAVRYWLMRRWKRQDVLTQRS